MLLVETSPAPPPATEPPAAPAEPAGPPLVLEADGPRMAGSRVKYPQNLADYAKRFDVSEKTLKRWVMRGRFEDEECTRPRTPIDLPPFHKPIDLPAWCERRMDNRAPEWVLRAAHEAAKTAPAAPVAPAPAVPEAPPPPPASSAPASSAPASSAPPAPDTQPPPPRDFSDVQALDFEANVHQLRISLAIDARLLDEAKLGQDEALTVKRQRSYRETYDLLRKSENDLLEWKQRVGKVAPYDEVRAENTRIAASIFAAVQRLVRNLRPKLAGRPDAEQDALWKDETLRCFVSLRDARFIDHEAALSGA